MMTPRSLTTALGILALTPIGFLHAGEPDLSVPLEYTPAPTDSWEFSVAPYLWMSALDGSAQVGPVASDIDLSFSDLLSNLDIAAMLTLEASKGRWGFQLDSLWFKLSADGGTSGALISSIKAEVEEIRIAPSVSYRVLEGETEVDLLVGLQYVSLDIDLSVKGLMGDVTKSGTDEDWIDPMVGFRGSHRISDRWSVIGRAEIGGFGVGSDLAWQLFAAVGYSWSPNATLYVGYRHLDIDYSSSGFDYDVSTSGPLIGARWTF